MRARVPLLVAFFGVAVVAGMLAAWYPSPLFQASGVARLPAAVTVVAILGAAVAAFLPSWRRRPVSRAAYRGILVALASAFAGCALALYVQRPVYLVFTVDRFDLVLAKDLAPGDLAKAGGEFSRRPLDGFRYAAAVQPADPAEAQRITDRALEGGKDLQAYPQHYVAYSQQAANALKRSQPLSKLFGRDDETLRRWLEAAGRTPESVRFLPLRAKKRDGIVLLDSASGLPLGELLIDPW